MTGTLPVLWLYGPNGVGKSTVAWELFTELSRDGVPTGYVDIDQLGICYPLPTPDNWSPDPLSDPGRHRMEARNLDVVAANLSAAGARCLIVSGVVDAVRGVDVELIPHAAVTSYRLRADPHDLRRRLAGRARPGEQHDAVLRYADALDRRGHADPCIDTTGHDVTGVLRLLQERTAGWPDRATPAATPSSDAALATASDGAAYGAAGEILWLCGASAVGKSTVGFEVYEQSRRAGIHTAFVDLQQIGFYRPAPPGDPGNHRVKAGNLAGIWQTFHAGGARRMVVVGPVEHPAVVRTYRAALPAARVTVYRLHAGRDQLTERIMLRGRGGGPPIPGDELAGLPVAQLHRIAEDAAAQAAALQHAGVGERGIDTDRRSVPDIARTILATYSTGRRIE